MLNGLTARDAWGRAQSRRIGPVVAAVPRQRGRVDDPAGTVAGLLVQQLRRTVEPGCEVLRGDRPDVDRLDQPHDGAGLALAVVDPQVVGFVAEIAQQPARPPDELVEIEGEVLPEPEEVQPDLHHRCDDKVQLRGGGEQLPGSLDLLGLGVGPLPVAGPASLREQPGRRKPVGLSLVSEVGELERVQAGRRELPQREPDVGLVGPVQLLRRGGVAGVQRQGVGVRGSAEEEAGKDALSLT